MTQWTVPDFFQQETADALRSQVDWLASEIGVDDSFFAKLLGENAYRVTAWRSQDTTLSPDDECILKQFWHTMLHIMSFVNFDKTKVRDLFLRELPPVPSGEAWPLSPPWSGSTLRAYFEQAGLDAIQKVDSWVTGLRFGDSNAA
jgi:hypothetical protein